MYDLLVSWWRTVVPTIVGVIVAQLARVGLHIDDAALTGWLTAAGITLYYGAFRALEQHVDRRFGWLLGLARPPQYSGGKSPEAG